MNQQGRINHMTDKGLWRDKGLRMVENEGLQKIKIERT